MNSRRRLMVFSSGPCGWSLALVRVTQPCGTAGSMGTKMTCMRLRSRRHRRQLAG
ncbi:hypothetical protein Ctob_013036 [Chrysochromulina tobinii]|uniref:Uncharacterized protein n=1 Tax=Chrysochromulina tobinii TaxID=1460289 RepID=A0A0M0K4C3_9EUKA|nr:hypothetical protein Ctob_013036 [Chrysochromulina tobinii]|eukprot:KOO33721.1 hypothetical protein Ctob_013036 [Chrysochromulina sp. CCMP291]